MGSCFLCDSAPEIVEWGLGFLFDPAPESVEWGLGFLFDPAPECLSGVKAYMRNMEEQVSLLEICVRSASRLIKTFQAP